MEKTDLENAKFIDIDASPNENGTPKLKCIENAAGGFYRLLTPYNAISYGGEKYNEAYLAALRDALKALESGGACFIIAPVAKNSAFSSIDNALELTAAFKHCARRLKDCQNLAGFEIPQGFAKMERSGELAENFINEFLEKHPHYFFAAAQEIFDALGEGKKKAFVI